MRRTAALIVGGGPAGAAAAIVLARLRHDARVIERRATPGGAVCGGFLGWDALASLKALGLDVARLGARPIERVRLVAGVRAVEAALPHPAAGLSRPALDAALLTLAEQAGARIEQGRAVRAIETEGALLDDGTIAPAGALVVATGKYNLRGIARRGSGEGAVGLRATIAAPADLAGTIELHLFDGGYAGLLVQEDGRANLCLSVSATRLRALGGTPAALLDTLARESPRLIDRIGGAPERWDTIAAVPYGWRATVADGARYRIGDQAAVIGSLAGDGVAIALASGVAAADAITRGEEAGRFQPRFAARAARPLAAAEALRHAAEHPRARTLLIGAARLPGAAALAARLTRIGT